MNDLKEIVVVLNSLGDKGLTAFVIYQARELIEFVIVLGMIFMGARGFFKFYKNNPERF